MGRKESLDRKKQDRQARLNKDKLRKPKRDPYKRPKSGRMSIGFGNIYPGLDNEEF